MNTLDNKALNEIAKQHAANLEQIFSDTRVKRSESDDKRARDDRASMYDAPQRGIPHQTVRRVRWC